MQANKSYEADSERDRARWRRAFIPHNELEEEGKDAFEIEAARLTWGRTRSELLRDSLRRAGIVVLIFFALNLLSSIPNPRLLNTEIIVFLILISLLDRFYLDFAVFSAGINFSNEDRSQYDANVSLRSVVIARHVVLQIAVFRVAVTAVAFRLCIALVVLWGVLRQFVSDSDALLAMSALLLAFVVMFVPVMHRSVAAIALFIFGVLAAVMWALSHQYIGDLDILLGMSALLLPIAVMYVLEPRWRLRTVAAGNIRTSYEPSGGFWHLVGALFPKWFSEIILLLIPVLGVYFILIRPILGEAAVSDVPSTRYMYINIVHLCGIVLMMLLGAIIYIVWDNLNRSRLTAALWELKFSWNKKLDVGSSRSL